MLLLAPLALCAPTTHLKVHAFFADGAVFQTTDDGGEGSAITGLAAPHEKITLSSNSKEWETKTVTADGTGAFSFAINRASGGPYDLTIGGAAGNVTAHDVLIGDVFICSGQAC